MSKKLSNHSILLACAIVILSLILSACSMPDTVRTLLAPDGNGSQPATKIADAPTATTDSNDVYGGKSSVQLTMEAGLPLPTLDMSTLPPPAQVQMNADGTVPDFTVLTFDNAKFKLSDQRGKVVLLNFWASWCGPCRSEMPNLTKLWSNYQDKNVIFIGIASQDSPVLSQQFAKTYEVKYALGSDVDDTITSSYKIEAFPTTILIDKHGMQNARLVGPIDPNGLPLLLDKLIAQP